MTVKGGQKQGGQAWTKNTCLAINYMNFQTIKGGQATGLDKTNCPAFRSNKISMLQGGQGGPPKGGEKKLSTLQLFPPPMALVGAANHGGEYV